jgi:hypothetical protein
VSELGLFWEVAWEAQFISRTVSGVCTKYCGAQAAPLQLDGSKLNKGICWACSEGLVTARKTQASRGDDAFLQVIER